MDGPFELFDHRSCRSQLMIFAYMVEVSSYVRLGEREKALTARDEFISFSLYSNIR